MDLLPTYTSVQSPMCGVRKTSSRNFLQYLTPFRTLHTRTTGKNAQPAPTNPVGVLFTQQPTRPGHMSRSSDKMGGSSSSSSSHSQAPFPRQMSQPGGHSHNAVRLSSLPVQAPAATAAAASSSGAQSGPGAGPRGWESRSGGPGGAASGEKKDQGPAVQSMSGTCLSPSLPLSAVVLWHVLHCWRCLGRTLLLLPSWDRPRGYSRCLSDFLGLGLHVDCTSLWRW